MIRSIECATAVAALVVMTALGCGDGGRAHAKPDAGATDAGVDAAFAWSDAGPRAECPGGIGEDCVGCYDNVGQCCYDEDPAWEAAKAALSEACGARAECAACCDECAAMSCDELMAADACPASE